jgi:hypothetical protein
VRVKIQAEWYEFETIGPTISSVGNRAWKPDLITADRRLPHLSVREKKALRESLQSGLQDQVRVRVKKFGHGIITDS